MTEQAYEPPDYISERTIIPDPAFLLDYYLKAHREAFDHWAQKPEDRTWRASSLGDCPRSQVLARRGVPAVRTPDDKTLRTFAWGDMVHEFVRKMFWRLGLVVAEEPRFVWPEAHITGHVDLVWNPAGTFRKPGDSPPSLPGHWSDEWRVFIGDLREALQDTFGAMYPDNTDNMLLGMELKSAHSFAMKRIFKEGPYEHHKFQVGIYAAMSQVMPGPLTDEKSGVTWNPVDIERWTIVYVGKDSTGMLAYEVEDEWVDDAISKVHRLNDYWAAGSLPPCECVDWKVKYCNYNEGLTCCGRNLKGEVAKAIRKGVTV